MTAVVILNWNGRKLLEEFLPSIVANTPASLGRVIVADNGSTDSSLEYLAQAYPGGEIDVMAFDRNYGFAEGYNKALRELHGKYEYAVLLNSDVAARENWLTPLVSFMDSHPDVAACAPKLLSYREPDKFEYAGASGGFLDRHGYPYCRGRIFDTVERDSGQYDMVIPVFWASGAALMVRSELYVKVGGLDKDFFAHMEEIDLCWRIKLAGYAVVVIPQSVVFHLGGGTLPASNPRKTYLNFRNNLLLLHKNLPDSSRKKRLLVRRLYDALAWVKFVVSLDFADASAVLRAHRDFRKMRANYTSHPDVDLLPKSPDIVVDYYLRRRKVYSDLD